jgi:hypothetical protein
VPDFGLIKIPKLIGANFPKREKCAIKLSTVEFENFQTVNPSILKFKAIKLSPKKTDRKPEIPRKSN